ncbi:MAG: hypothetical protein K2W96_10220 [Gemmataceae bacterium]|nr:hypothetical protein [Gemmataceae bacterium]
MLKERIKLLAGEATPRPLGELTDPVLIARIEAVSAATARNDEWLDANIESLLPQARGKVLIVAGQEAFIGDDYAEVRARRRESPARHRQGRSHRLLP